MKKHLNKLVVALALSSVFLSSCSLEYRERHHRGRDQNQGRYHGRDYNNRDGNYHHYNNY